MEKNYILFPASSYGLKLEKLLKAKNIKYTISPTPRSLSKSCGISIMYNKTDEKTIKSIVDENTIEIIGFYTID